MCVEDFEFPKLTIPQLDFKYTDSSQEKKMKRLAYDKAVFEMDQLRKSREGEMLRKFDEIVEKVRQSRMKKRINDTEMYSSTEQQIQAQVINVRLQCDECGNKVNYHILFIIY